MDLDHEIDSADGITGGVQLRWEDVDVSWSQAIWWHRIAADPNPMPRVRLFCRSRRCAT